VIGVTLMRIGINWIFGLPVGPTAPKLVSPEHAAWLEQVRALADVPDIPGGLALAPSAENPGYATLQNMSISAIVPLTVILVMKFARGFWSNIAVLCGIAVGGMTVAALGLMRFDRLGEASWFALIAPFHFGMPIVDPIMILTMTLVMIVVMIESTGMFLALSDMCGKKLERPTLSARLRTDGLDTLIGGLFNTFPYTSFSQNVGVTGIRSRYVCVMGGAIMIVLGLIP